jgi:hypothetical protein
VTDFDSGMQQPKFGRMFGRISIGRRRGSLRVRHLDGGLCFIYISSIQRHWWANRYRWLWFVPTMHSDSEVF